MSKKKTTPGPPTGAVKPPPPPPPPVKAQEAKVCKRCKKDKIGDKKFSKKQQLCNSCQVMIAYYKKRGEPVPEYKPRGEKQKKKVTVTIDNPLGEIKDMKPIEPIIKEKIKKTEVVTVNDRGDFQIKMSLDPFYYLNIDFSEYPELKKRLDELAVKDFRTSSLQVMAILDRFFEINKESHD